MSIWIPVVVYIVAGTGVVGWNETRAFVDPAECEEFAVRMALAAKPPGPVENVVTTCISIDRDKMTVSGEQAS